jgi:hypothetical protein
MVEEQWNMFGDMSGQSPLNDNHRHRTLPSAFKRLSTINPQPWVPLVGLSASANANDLPKGS